MPILSFEVEANYEEVIRLREEVGRLENALKTMGPGSSVQAIKSLEEQLASSRSRFKELADIASKAGSEVQANAMQMAKAAEVYKNYVGGVFGSTENMLSGLKEVIKETNENIQKGEIRLAGYGEQLKKAFEAGDETLANSLMKDISNTTADIQALKKNAEEFRQVMSTLEKQDGLDTTSTVTRKRFYKSENDWGKARTIQDNRDLLVRQEGQLSAELSDTQNRLMDLSLPADEVQKLIDRQVELSTELGNVRSRIAEENTELERLRSGAEAAADALGKNAEKGTELSEKTYATNLRVREQEKALSDLNARLAETADARKAADDAGDMDAVARYDSQIEALNLTIQNGTARLAEYKSEQKELQAELDRFNAASSQPMYFSNMSDWKSEKDLSASQRDLSSEANSLRLDETRLMTDMALMDQSNPAYGEMQTELDNVRAALADTESQLESTTTQLDALHQKGTEAAAALGSELGEKAAEVSDRYYTLQQAIWENNKTIRDAKEDLSEYKERLSDVEKELSALEGKSTLSPDETQRIRELTSETEELKNKIEETQETIDNASNNVQRFSEDIKQAESALSDMKKETGESEGIMTKFMGGQENLNKIMEHLPEPIKKVVSGIGGITKASLAFLATPIGIVVGALALAFSALYKWLTSTTEGQKKLAVITGYVSGIFGQFQNFVVKAGEMIYNAVTHPVDAVKKLGKALKENLINRLRAVPEILGAIGRMATHIFKGEWSKAGDELKNLTNGLLKVGSGVDDVIGKVSNMTSKLHSAGKAMAKVSLDQKNLELDKSEFEETKTKLAGDKATQMAIARDTSKSPAERQAAVDRIKEIGQEIRDKEGGFLDREITNQTESMRYSPTSIVDEATLNRLLARKQALQTQKEQSAASLKRLENGIRKSGEAEGKYNKNMTNQLIKLEKSEMERLDKEERELDMALEDLRIRRMKEGTEREIAEAKQQGTRKLNALEDQAKAEAKKLRDNDLKKWLNSGGDSRHKRTEADWVQTKTEEEYLAEAKRNMGFDIKQAIIEEDTENLIEKAEDKEAKAMRDYMRKYGTYQQKLDSLDAEYEKQIEDATTEGDRMILRKEWKDAQLKLQRESDKFIKSVTDVAGTLSRLDSEMRTDVENAIKRGASGSEIAGIKEDYRQKKEKVVMDKMNTQTMGDSSNTTIGELMAMYNGLEQEVLEKLKQRIEGYLAENKDVLGADSQAKIRDSIQKIDDEMAKRATAWTQVIGGIPQMLAKHKELQDNLKKAQENYDNAVKTRDEKVGAKNTARGNLLNMLKDKGVNEQEANKAIDEGKLTEKFGEAFKDNPEFNEAIESFSMATTEAAAAQEGVTAAAGELGAAQGAATGGGGAALTDAIIHGVNDNMQSVPELLEQWGLDDTGFGKGMQDFAESSQYATQAFDALKSGNIVGVITNLTNAFGSLGTAIGKWFGGGGLFGESDINLAEDMQRLAESNGELRNAIEKLSDDLRDASTGESISVYREQKRNLEGLMKTTQNIMQRAGAAYNNGFLGIGGSGSSNKKINREMSAADWSAVSVAAGRSVRSASDFWKLTSEQMANVAKHATAQWTIIKTHAADGYADAQQYMDEYITFYEELEQLQDQYNLKLTDTSWDSVADGFKSMLLNMESDADTFAESFEDMMRQAVLNSMMDSIFNERLKKWYEKFAKYMESDVKPGGSSVLTKAHQDELEAEYKAMASDAMAQRDMVMDLLDWDLSLSQKGAKTSFSGMSQDTGNAIEGRLTAIQMYLGEFRPMHESSALSLASITDFTLRMLEVNMEDSAIYRDILLCANKCYLELIEIQQNTGAVVSPIREMADNISDIQRKLKTL